uniref:Uncharacterized protein n=1 Tax=Arundo donax TaxID=35708 RepID=A0A0A9D6P1_ARUDO
MSSSPTGANETPVVATARTGQTWSTSYSSGPSVTGSAAPRGSRTSSPARCAYTTTASPSHAPQSSPSPAATRARASTSPARTEPVSVPGAASCTRVRLVTRHHPAPWQLNTPTTPPHLFMFQILSKLAPSRAGSEKRQSRVGRPGSCARSTEPSGRTSFLSRSKLWFPGLSLTYIGHPPIALAAPWYSAAGCKLWNMSQSGCMNSPRKRVLYETAATWTVCDAGSRG